MFFVLSVQLCQLLSHFIHGYESHPQIVAMPCVSSLLFMPTPISLSESKHVYEASEQCMEGQQEAHAKAPTYC